VFAVVVRPAVDRIALRLGGDDRLLAHDVGVGRQLRRNVSLPAIGQPERAERRFVRFARQNALKRLSSLFASHVVGRLRARADHCREQPLERPVAEFLGCVRHVVHPLGRIAQKSPASGARSAVN